MKKIIFLFVCVFISACGVVDKFRKNDVDPALLPNPLTSIEEEVVIDRQWSSSIGGGGKEIYLHPAIAATTVFIASPSGQVANVDLTTGKTIWRTSLDISVSGGVGAHEGLVLLGGLEGEVVALDQRDGSVVWSTTVSSEVLATPVADQGVAIVRSIDGVLTGLSTINGEKLWKFSREVPSLTLRGESPPIIQQGVALVGSADGRLVALDVSSGAVLWNVPVSRASGTNEVERMIDVDSRPLLVGSVLYAGSFQGNVTAFALGANRILWTKEASTHTDLAADGQNLYVSTSNGEVRAFDRLSGEQLWFQDALLRRELSGPAVIGEYLVVGDFDGYLHVLDKKDGRLVGRSALGGRIAIKPLITQNQILVFTQSGNLRLLSLVEES